MAGDRAWVGVNVGGTKVLAGVVDDAGSIVRTARRQTPGRRVDARTVEDALTEAVRKVADGRELTAVGVAAAGFVDARGERVRFAPHLPWLDEPVRDRLEHRWGFPSCSRTMPRRFGMPPSKPAAITVTRTRR